MMNSYVFVCKHYDKFLNATNCFEFKIKKENTNVTGSSKMLKYIYIVIIILLYTTVLVKRFFYFNLKQVKNCLG